jgi:hypothetical protein
MRSGVSRSRDEFDDLSAANPRAERVSLNGPRETILLIHSTRKFLSVKRLRIFPAVNSDWF